MSLTNELLFLLYYYKNPIILMNLFMKFVSP